MVGFQTIRMNHFDTLIKAKVGYKVCPDWEDCLKLTKYEKLEHFNQLELHEYLQDKFFRLSHTNTNSLQLTWTSHFIVW